MDSNERYQREPEHDKSKAQGDARTEEAWRDTESGELILVAERFNPNTLRYEYEPSPLARTFLDFIARTKSVFIYPHAALSGFSYYISLPVFVATFFLALKYFLYQPCVAYGGTDCGMWYWFLGGAPLCAIVNPLSVILFYALRRFVWKREVSATSNGALAFVSGVLGGALGVAGLFLLAAILTVAETGYRSSEGSYMWGLALFFLLPAFAILALVLVVRWLVLRQRRADTEDE